MTAEDFEEYKKKQELATQLLDTAAELARLGAMCCSNDPRTELERMAMKWLKAAAWMKNKADELKKETEG